MLKSLENSTSTQDLWNQDPPRSDLMVDLISTSSFSFDFPCLSDGMEPLRTSLHPAEIRGHFAPSSDQDLGPWRPMFRAGPAAEERDGSHHLSHRDGPTLGHLRFDLQIAHGLDLFGRELLLRRGVGMALREQLPTQ